MLGPNVCPALAWFNAVTVPLDGHAAMVQLVELCKDGVGSVHSDGPVGVLRRQEATGQW